MHAALLYTQSTPADAASLMQTARRSPSVTAILLSYDCEAWIGAALDGVLAQDYPGPMEIVVSDDASRDASFAIARARAEQYRGGRRLVVKQRQSNSGSKSAHLNDVVPGCSGELFVSFDADDVSLPTRVSRIVDRFLANPAAQAVYSSFVIVGDDDRPARRARVPHAPSAVDAASWFSRIDAYAAGATLAVRRGVLDAFGPLDPSLNEDVQLPFRAGLLGDVEYIDEPLVRVNRHAGSFTADWRRYDSLQAYRERMQVGLDTAARARRSRLADIDTVARLCPDRQERWNRLRGLVERSAREAEITRSLVSDRLGERLGGLLALIRAGAYREELFPHAFLALAPKLYLAYRRRRLG
jgi:glycosyltransferase involved in cell wall biosynthesis